MIFNFVPVSSSTYFASTMCSNNRSLPDPRCLFGNTVERQSMEAAGNAWNRRYGKSTFIRRFFNTLS